MSANRPRAKATGASRRKTIPLRSGFNWGNWGGGAIGSSRPKDTAPVPLPPDPASRGRGYLPDIPDPRDWSIPQVRDVLEGLEQQNKNRAETDSVRIVSFLLSSLEDGASDSVKKPPKHDLRDTGFFTRVEDQGVLGSCTAQAVVGLIEYLMNAGGVRAQDMSRMFVYKNARRLLGFTGDTGAFLRTTIKAVALFGAPPESEWPYDHRLLDAEPEAYHYAFASNFKTLRYARLDPHNQSGGTTLDRVKSALLDGFPAVFGFPLFSSIDLTSQSWPVIPWPSQHDRDSGGHAVLAVGYDDDYETNLAGEPGALIIRNSWGRGWGQHGYGYLPYRYVETQLAVDFWSIFNDEWIDLDVFG